MASAALHAAPSCAQPPSHSTPRGETARSLIELNRQEFPRFYRGRRAEGEPCAEPKYPLLANTALRAPWEENLARSPVRSGQWYVAALGITITNHALCMMCKATTP